MHEEVFVPETSLATVDEAWDKLCNQNSKFYDGDIVHVLSVNRTGCGGASIQVAQTSYRFHAVGTLGINPLGVKGICIQNDLYLCGKRGTQMGAYPNMWEFAPSGMVEPNQIPEYVIERELEEETGLHVSSPPIATAIFFDDTSRTWEIVYQLAVIGTPQVGGNEYQQLDWFDIKALPSPMSPPAIQMKSLL